MARKTIKIDLSSIGVHTGAPIKRAGATGRIEGAMHISAMRTKLFRAARESGNSPEKSREFADSAIREMFGR
jgi:hypothetical protein